MFEAAFPVICVEREVYPAAAAEYFLSAYAAAR